MDQGQDREGQKGLHLLDSNLLVALYWLELSNNFIAFPELDLQLVFLKK